MSGLLAPVDPLRRPAPRHPVLDPMLWTLSAALALAPSALAAPGPDPSSDPAARESPAPQDPADELFVRAATLYLDGGRVVEDGVLHVRGGLVETAGRGVEVPDGAAWIEHDGVLTAGLIGGVSALGAADELHDPTRALLPAAHVAHAYKPTHGDFERMVAFGITAVVLAPTEHNVVGGVSAVAPTDGGELIAREAHLTLSFSGAALPATREPTSYSGALRVLREAFAEPSGPLAEAAGGRLPVLLHARSRHEVARAAAFAREHGLAGALAGAPLGGELLDELRGSELGVVVGPFGPGTPRRVLASVAALSEAGLAVAFAVADPDGRTDPLRFSAALAVRGGLDPPAAWRALTSDAARLAGVAERAGSLEPGKRADFVLWDGDPLDLTSSVEAVYVAGRLVHRAGDAGDPRASTPSASTPSANTRSARR